MTDSLFAAQGTSKVTAVPTKREDLSTDPGLGPTLLESSGTHEVALQATPTDRSNVFVAVTGAETKETSSTTLVVAAYSLFWVFSFVMIWLTFRGQKNVLLRISEIERKLPKGDQTP
jgi:hypothetical protein